MSIVFKILYFIFLFILSHPVQAAFFGLFGSDSFYECILDDMPGVKSHPEANSIYKACSNKHPIKDPVEKERPWLFGPKSTQQCLKQYGEDYHQAGIVWIREACYKLYYFD